MAQRNYLPPNALLVREVNLAREPLPPHTVPIDDPRRLHRVPNPPPPSSAAPRHHPALLEDHIAAQQRDIQAILVDNQRLAATHVALKQELSAAQTELRHLSATAADVKSQSDAQVREVYEKLLRTEAEVRSIDDLNSELAQVTKDVQKLAAERRELTSKLQTIDCDLAVARSDLQQLPLIKAEIEAMHQEVQRGRAAVEYERRTHAAYVQQGQAMERNMMSMAREIEKLRVEFDNAETRTKATAAVAAAANPSVGYAAGYGNIETGYAVSSYPTPYIIHQVQGSANAGQPQYGSVVVTHVPYDMQRTHVHR